MNTGKQETKTKGMCIATRCTSVDQFVQMFHRFVEDQSFFVSTLNTRPPGLETSFSVQLADGTPVLRGLCVVQQAWTTPANPFKTPGVRLGIKRLTAQSTPVFERLLATRNAARKPPPSPHLASIVVAKPGTPKPIAKSPYTETAPTVSAPSRIDIKLPARPASEPTTVEPERASTGDGVPRAVAAETTDMMEEKTDVRVPSIPVAALAAGSVVAAKPGAPPKPLDVKEVARPLAPAEPVRDNARTPGSDLVLPANPLMNLSDESLEGYVDCTLYEETGNFFPADDDTSFGDDVAPPPGAEPAAAAAAAADGNPRAAAAPARFDTASSLVTPPPMPPPPAAPRESLDPSLIARGSTPVLPGDAPKQTADDAPSIIIEGGDAAPKLPLAAPTVESAPLSVAASDVLVPTPRKRPPWLVFGGGARPPWLLLGGGAGVLAVTTLVIVMTTSSNGGARAPAAPAPMKAAANEVVPAVKVEPPVAKPPVPEDGEDAEEPEESPSDAPTVGSGPCKVVVHTTPAGSIVKLDGNSVGPSPITVAASCGKHKVDIVHPRYAVGSKLVTLETGKAETLEMTLSRPTHVVTVTSSPSGAQIFLNGRSAGTTPTKLNVLGFVTLKLELKKTGYQPASAKLYSKKAQDNIAVRLSKW